MSRPKKQNADYFSHDNDMRNNRKIKAVRSKFGLVGYATYCMLLEILTQADRNRVLWDEIEIEVIAGDIAVEAEFLQQFVTYCLRLKLFEMDQSKGELFCSSLDERLESVYKKRALSRKRSNSQFRQNDGTFGVSATETTESNGEPVTESPQSKVKEIKGNKRKVKNSGSSKKIDSDPLDKKAKTHPADQEPTEIIIEKILSVSRQKKESWEKNYNLNGELEFCAKAFAPWWIGKHCVDQSDSEVLRKVNRTGARIFQGAFESSCLKTDWIKRLRAEYNKAERRKNKTFANPLEQ